MMNSLCESPGLGLIQPFAYADPRMAAMAPHFVPMPEPVVTEAEALEREERARSQSRAEVEAGLAAEAERQRQANQAAWTASLGEFERQRRQYFRAVEKQVVELALAMARKILQREAEADPLLLAGSVEAALTHLAAQTKVELLVPPSQLGRWREFVRGANLVPAPEIRPDAALEPNGCRIAAESGEADLSLELQMDEIEASFRQAFAEREVHA